MALKRGLQYGTPVFAAVISLTVNALCVWAFAAVAEPLGRLLTPQIVPFLVAGFIAPGVARLALFVGFERIGVARATPMVATAPLFSVSIAMLVLGERPSAVLLLGVACIVGGGILLSYRNPGDKTWRRRDMLFPLLAALGFALRDIVSRWGLIAFPRPMLGAAAATAASVATIWLFAGGQHVIQAHARRARPTRATPATGPLRYHPVGLAFFAISGGLEGLAYLAMWRAMALGTVSVVSPLVQASPLFTLVFAAMLLRDLERITWRISVASILTVLGMFFVIMARNG